jgi:hypothetical protein
MVRKIRGCGINPLIASHANAHCINGGGNVKFCRYERFGIAPRGLEVFSAPRRILVGISSRI